MVHPELVAHDVQEAEPWDLASGTWQGPHALAGRGYTEHHSPVGRVGPLRGQGRRRGRERRDTGGPVPAAEGCAAGTRSAARILFQAVVLGLPAVLVDGLHERTHGEGGAWAHHISTDLSSTDISSTDPSSTDPSSRDPSSTEPSSADPSSAGASGAQNGAERGSAREAEQKTVERWQHERGIGHVLNDSPLQASPGTDLK